MEDLRKKYQSIKPVLILNANTLIEYFGYFKRDKTNLTNLIKDYFEEINRRKKQYHTNIDDIHSYLMSSISFDRYLQKKLKNETIVQRFEAFSKDFETELSGLDFSQSK